VTLRKAESAKRGGIGAAVSDVGEKPEPARSRAVAEIAVAGARRATGGSDGPAVRTERTDTVLKAGTGTSTGVRRGSQEAAADTGTCLRQCRDLLMPVAARRGVLVELAAGDDLPAVAVDGKLLRQALYVVLADMIDTCAEGAVVTLGAGVQTGRLDCAMSVRNRQPGLGWTASGSNSALEVAGRLLECTPARISVRATKDQGDCVIVQLPLEAGTTAAADIVGQARTA